MRNTSVFAIKFAPLIMLPLKSFSAFSFAVSLCRIFYIISFASTCCFSCTKIISKTLGSLSCPATGYSLILVVVYINRAIFFSPALYLSLLYVIFIVSEYYVLFFTITFCASIVISVNI